MTFSCAAGIPSCWCGSSCPQVRCKEECSLPQIRETERGKEEMRKRGKEKKKNREKQRKREKEKQRNRENEREKELERDRGGRGEEYQVNWSMIR